MSDLRTKILGDLEKSGFGTEMRVARFLLDRRWIVESAYTFFDRDERISRETDLRAYFTRRAMVDAAPVVSMFTYLAIEVKKSKKPWVVFGHEVPRKWPPGGAWGQLIEATNLPCRGLELVSALEAMSLASRQGWRGYGVHEAFKPPDKPSRWWAASVSACKAAEGVVSGQRLNLQRGGSEPASDLKTSPCFVHFVKPAVVLDGRMFSASVDDHGEIRLEHTTAATLQFRFRTENYSDRHAYYVDLVTYDGLGQYVTDLESGAADFVRAIAGKAGFSDSEWRLDETPIEY